jgi:uncharacterized protein DUF4157
MPSWALVSQPTEVEERRADARAAEVLRTPAARPTPPAGGGGGRGGDDPDPSARVSTAASTATSAMGTTATTAGAVPAGGGMATGVPGPVRDQAGRGQALAAADRDWFAPRFGSDLGHVRVHTDPGAASLAEAVAARAFTVGSHVFFNHGEYRPGTPSGRALLAHELAHVEQAGTGGALGVRLWRKPQAVLTDEGPKVDEPDVAEDEAAEEWVHLEVFAIGMDAAAMVLSEAGFNFKEAAGRPLRFVGLHPQFVKVYDSDGKARGARIKLKETKGLRFNRGVYVQTSPAKGLVALTQSTKDPSKVGFESTSRSPIGSRDLTDKEKAELDAEIKQAEAEKRAPKPVTSVLNFPALVSEPERYQQMLGMADNPVVIYFVPTYDLSGGTGKGEGEQRQLYASPIEGRGDGKPANAHPWPVSVEGPKLAPIDSDPTYAAKVDWSAGGGSVAAMAISQVGETIHYKWELFDITQYAEKAIAKDPAGAKTVTDAPPEKTLDQRIEEFKTSKAGAGKDVTGIGGANREFTREFEDWWKDTKRASKGARDPSGDTVGERMSNAVANRVALELAPVTLLTTAVGAALRWLADLFAGPRQEQEIPLEKKGIFLVRVITTPAINEDKDGQEIIRPPSVAARVVEVTSMERAVTEALDEPGAQLAELQAQIDLAEKAGETSKAEYLRDLLATARLRFQGSPLDLLQKQLAEKTTALEKHKRDFKNLSHYTLERDVSLIEDQIALHQRHAKQVAPGRSLQRLNATLISEVTAQQYPLLLSAAPMVPESGGKAFRWLVSDVTNRDGDAFVGQGDTSAEAFESALRNLGGKAAYGRGTIGVRTEGLGLEASAKPTIYVESAPTDWALAEKRIDDLVTTLAVLGLFVASAGTAGAVIGAGVAAARLVQRWQAGKLYLDAQTVSDVLGVMGGLGASLQLAAGLRVQKFDKAFAVVQEGRASEAQVAKAAEALTGAQKLARGVELANEALNYGGVIWGNVAFLDQMLSINAQEASGAMTHAEARRARAGAISAAVQNNGLFIAGNVLKAKAQAKAAETPPAKGKPTETTAPTREKVPAEGPPTDKVPVDKTPADKAPGQKGPAEEGPAKEVEPSTKPAASADKVPIGERRATLEEMQAALSPDLRQRVQIDTTLTGDGVEVDYKVDAKTGLVSEIGPIRCSPDARPSTVRLHEATVRTMESYQGFMGRVRQAISWLADVVGIQTIKPENKVAFEAALEIQKLPKAIEQQMQRMRAAKDLNARDMAAAELENLQNKLDMHLRTLGHSEGGEAVGYVAVKGLSKANQKKYAELATKLRAHEPGTDAHRDLRWEMYKLTSGDLPYQAWENVYYGNVGKARKAAVAELAEMKRLGWGEHQKTVDVPGGGGEQRRIDIGEVTPTRRRGVEVKAYESGKVYLEAEGIGGEIAADAKLIRYAKWEITWLFVGCEPSGPLLAALHKAGITVEVRTRGQRSRVIPPPAK